MIIRLLGTKPLPTSARACTVAETILARVHELDPELSDFQMIAQGPTTFSLVDGKSAPLGSLEVKGSRVRLRLERDRTSYTVRAGSVNASARDFSSIAQALTSWIRMVHGRSYSK